MKVIILGATGAVGQSLAKATVREKHEVTLFVRNKAKLEALLGSELLSQCRVCGLLTRPILSMLSTSAVELVGMISR